jgi:hypothetical protein
MQVQGVDERHMRRGRDGVSLVVFIHRGGRGPHSPWGVDSRLITDADLPEVLHWLSGNLPQDCCWVRQSAAVRQFESLWSGDVDDLSRTDILAGSVWR